MPSTCSRFCILLLLISNALAERIHLEEVEEESEAEFRILTEEELRQSRLSLLSISEAEEIVRSEVAEAFARQARATGVREAQADGPNVEDKPVEDESQLEEELEAALKQPEKDFQADQWKKVTRGLQPTVQGYICIQLDIDLTWMGIPGLGMNLGLMGGVFIGTDTGCWGASLELSFGVQWGFKFLDYGVGIGASRTGSMDVMEVPPATVLGDKESLDKDPSLFAPAGEDLNRCHTSSPWVLVQTIIEHEVRRIFSSKKLKDTIEEIRKENAKLKKREDAFHESYEKLLNGRFYPPENLTVPKSRYQIGPHDYGVLTHDVPHGWYPPEDQASVERKDSVTKSVVWAPLLLAPGAAMTTAMRAFAAQVPAYAMQVIRRLVDNTHKYFGTDGSTESFFFGKSDGLNRLEHSSGRYWARWPSHERFRQLCEGRDCDKEKPLPGMTKQKLGTDQRVLNFAKAMRLSEHVRELRFWKELALSAGNLLVRVVGDMKALFSAAFADDANWDGSCEALKSAFEVGEDIRPEVLSAYPWASGSTTSRAQFSQQKHDSRRRAFTTVLDDFPRWEVDGGALLYPHLWCALLRHAPAEEQTGRLSKFQDATEPVEITVPSSCQNVARMTRSVLGGENIQWDEEKQYWRVTYEGHHVGFISTDDPLVPLGISELGKVGPNIKISIKVAETRPECERVRLPVPFVRLFPRFVYTVEKYIAKMEETLNNINRCVGEVGFQHADENDDSATERPWQCVDFQSQRLAYVKDTAKDAVRLVRRFLLRIGAEDPRVDSDYQDGVLPISEDEHYLAEYLYHEDHFAPLVRTMVQDFEFALGMGPLPAKSRATGRPGHFEGRFWKHVPELRSTLLHIADPLNRIFSQSRIRPPLEFTRGIVWTGQLSLNGFCTPNTGLLMVSTINQETMQTWSTRSSTEACFVGRIRPGDVFIQILRCSGNNGGQGGDFGKYVDWRVRYQVVMVKGDVLTEGMSGVIGNILTNNNVLSAAALSAGAIAGGALSGEAIDKFAPRVQRSPVASTLLLMATANGPLLGAVAGGVAVTGTKSFEAVCNAFLDHLSSHGIITAPGDPELGFKFNMLLVVWGATIFREKTVTVQDGPGSFKGVERTVSKSQRFSSLHVEGWSRAEVTVPIPSLGSVTSYGKLEIDWDLTPWVEAVSNRRLYEENKVRQGVCKGCLRDGMAFCDWRLPLGTLWNATEMDICRPDTQDARESCHRNIGLVDDVGEPITAAWFHPADRSEACDTIQFPRSNREFHLSDQLRMFLRRH